MPPKLPSGRCKCCAGLVTDKGAAELIFKRVNAGANRRLADVNPIAALMKFPPVTQ